MKFWDFSYIYFKVLSREASREPTNIYQFITNNHALFHLLWKEDLLNHQKILKY